MRIVLASASPRRRDLLQQAGVRFDVVVGGADEHLDDELRADPSRAARELARRKAGATVQLLLASLQAPMGRPVETPAGSAFVPLAAGETAVIGADTMVVSDGRIFGKPAGAAQAHDMLRALSGRTHQVITGVAVVMLQVDARGQVTMGQAAFSEVSEVTFRALSDDEIDAYVATGEGRDKAGAYAIQGQGALLVERTEGAFDNIVGLPVETLLAQFPQLAG